MNSVNNSEARPFTFGGAVRILWVNPTDADYDHVIILKKVTNDFAGPTDPAATTIHRGIGIQASEFRSVFLPYDVAHSDLYRTILDATATAWNTTFYYAIYAANADEIDVSTSVVLSVVMPQVSAFEELDVVGTLMTFIKSYLDQQIAVGALILPPGVTDIQVFDGPPMMDNAKFPLVSIHLDDDHPIGFAIGDDIGHMNDTGDLELPRRGFMSSVTVAVVGVTNNPEIRRPLYRLLKGALIAARQLLEQQGLMNIELSGRYAEDFVNYDSPLFSAELILRGSVATSVAAVYPEQPIGMITVAQGTLTPVPIDP